MPRLHRVHDAPHPVEYQVGTRGASLHKRPNAFTLQVGDAHGVNAIITASKCALSPFNV